ncbi:MAG: glycosyltransferase [Hydrogenophilales bacterium 17-61-76]|nr:MAG: glycosyltransferase [Hydrogenophilales bacterium 17-61-76]
MSDLQISPARLRIKFLGKFKPGLDGDGWLKCFPGRQPRWGNCDFIFDRDCRDYDWLVVYDDLPSEPWATGKHPGLIFQQPALIWFYATSSPRGDYDSLLAHVPMAKTADLSTVCSSKRQGHTLHRARYDFTQALKAKLPFMEIYGHGVRPMVDKADALDPYRYHLAIENHLGPHHWTEKLADPFIGACMPVYYGCPNAEDYFPPESFIRIDIAAVDAAAETIQRAHVASLASPASPVYIQSRRRLHRQWLPGLRYGLEKLYVRNRHRWAGD